MSIDLERITRLCFSSEMNDSDSVETVIQYMENILTSDDWVIMNTNAIYGPNEELTGLFIRFDMYGMSAVFIDPINRVQKVLEHFINKGFVYATYDPETVVIDLYVLKT